MSKSKFVEFKIKSIINFQIFLKRFQPISKSIILELHDDFMQAKTNTEDRAIVKFSKVFYSDVLELRNSEIDDLIKVGVFDLTKITKVFSHFKDSDEIFFKVQYETIGGEKIATEMLFYNDSLRIKVNGTDTTTMTYISDEMVKKIIASVNDQKVIDFSFPKDAFVKLNSLSSIDDGKDFLTLKVSDGKITVEGKSFTYDVADAPSDKKVDYTFYNEHMEYIEQEISHFVVGKDKMIVKSQESNTFILIGRVE